MLYLLSILFCVIIIAMLNILFLPQTLGFAFWQIIIWSVVATISVIVIDGLMATLIRWICPQKWFVFGKKIFVAKKKECFFYEKLGIKKWKDKVLELGQFTSFRKNKIYLLLTPFLETQISINSSLYVGNSILLNIVFLKGLYFFIWITSFSITFFPFNSNIIFNSFLLIFLKYFFSIFSNSSYTLIPDR